MANLSLNTIELVSNLRPVAQNGAPSSEDYNDSQQETLLDLTTVATFINNVLIPMFKSLPDLAVSGLEGRTIYGDLTDQTSLFYDSVAGESLSVADSLRLLSSIISSLKNTVNSNTIQVGQLQQKLSSTNQNDFALAIQNLESSLNTLNSQQLSSDAAITELQTEVNARKVQRTSLTISNNSTSSQTVNWATAFTDNNYTVAISLNTTSSAIQVTGFDYLANGAGVTIYFNSTANTPTAVIVNLIAEHD